MNYPIYNGDLEEYYQYQITIFYGLISEAFTK